MKVIINEEQRRSLIREFGERVSNWNDWLEGIYGWDTKPQFDHKIHEIVAYGEGEEYLGYWDSEDNAGFVVTELVGETMSPELMQDVESFHGDDLNLSNLTEDYYDSRKSVDGYVSNDDMVGEHIWAHTNRTHRNNGWNGMVGIYNVTGEGTRTGKAGRYSNEVRLTEPIHFQTSEPGAKRIQKSREEKGKDKRQLIAGVSGVVIPVKGSLGGFEKIDYDPFDTGHAYFKINGDPEKKEIISAGEVYLRATEDGTYFMFAKDIKFKSYE
jgi:hypothetical protein